jgi:gas vesicle protein
VKTMSDRDEFGAFLVGFIVGGLAGAAAALMLAPQSGTETRKIIRERSIELRDKAAETLDEAYDQAEEAAIEARKRFEDLAKKTKEKTEDLSHRGQILLDEQKARLSEVLPKKKPAAPKPAEGDLPA